MPLRPDAGDGSDFAGTCDGVSVRRAARRPRHPGVGDDCDPIDFITLAWPPSQWRGTRIWGDRGVPDLPTRETLDRGGFTATTRVGTGTWLRPRSLLRLGAVERVVDIVRPETMAGRSEQPGSTGGLAVSGSEMTVWDPGKPVKRGVTGFGPCDRRPPRKSPAATGFSGFC